MADREVNDAFARSFLRALPPELVAALRSEGERTDYPAGTTIYRAGSDPRAVLVVQGLIRVYMTSSEGRQVTVRYARPGDVLGIAVLVGGPANVDVQALAPSSLFRISARMLTGAARRDARVAWAMAEELNRRLYETLAADGDQCVRLGEAARRRSSSRSRLRPAASAWRLVAHVSQQELADAVGSVREVVARVLRDFRVAGIVATSSDSVLILDAARLHSESGDPAGL